MVALTISARGDAFRGGVASPVLVVAAGAIGAIGATLALVLVAVATAVDPATVWQSWWIAFTTGVIFAAPAVLMFRRSRVALTQRRLAELVVAIAVTVAVLSIVLGSATNGTVSQMGRSILVDSYRAVVRSSV